MREKETEELIELSGQRNGEHGLFVGTDWKRERKNKPFLEYLFF